jgi:hypothetical protein
VFPPLWSAKDASPDKAPIIDGLHISTVKACTPEAQPLDSFPFDCPNDKGSVGLTIPSVLPAHHCYTIMSATPAEQHAAEHETSTLNGSAANVAPVISEKEKVVDAEAAPPPPPPAAFDVPDGGLEAWSVVLGGWLVLFSTFGYVNGESIGYLPFKDMKLTLIHSFRCIRGLLCSRTWPVSKCYCMDRYIV